MGWFGIYQRNMPNPNPLTINLYGAQFFTTLQNIHQAGRANARLLCQMLGRI